MNAYLLYKETISGAVIKTPIVFKDKEEAKMVMKNLLINDNKEIKLRRGKENIMIKKIDIIDNGINMRILKLEGIDLIF